MNHALIQLLKQTGVVGWGALGFLFILSVLSWAVMAVKWLRLRSVRRADAAFLESFRKSTTLLQAQQAARRWTTCSNSEIFLAGYREIARQSSSRGSLLEAGDQLHQGMAGPIQIPALERALARAHRRQRSGLRRHLPLLATAGSVSPFIGLFGTVWGVMRAFQNIGMQASASLAVVAPGIAEALVATAAGLAVAIPAVMGYNYFTARVHEMSDEAEQFAMEFLTLIETLPKASGNTSSVAPTRKKR